MILNPGGIEDYTNTEYLIVRDHIPPSNNLHIYRDYDIVDTSDCLDFGYDYRKYNNQVTIFDDYLIYTGNDRHFCNSRIFLAEFFLRSAKKQITFNTNKNINNQVNFDKKVNFCALMNKLRPPRSLLSLWLKNNFGTNDNFYYTQGFDDPGYEHLSCLVHDTPYANLIAPNQTNTLQKKFIGSYKKNAENYQQYIKQIEQQSIVNIITEPVFAEQGALITEKTLQSCMSGCIPFFVCGYFTPDYFEKLGFYAFQDVIDYSAFSEPDPAVKTLKLLDDNKNLLKNGIDISKYKYEIEHNANHVLDIDSLLKASYYNLNDITLFDQWYDVIVQHYPVYKRLEKIL